MAANGKIPTSKLSALPRSWSNKGEVEHLTSAAYAALSRALAFAAADGVSGFTIYDAYRPYSEQRSIFLARYYPVRSGADKRWNGVGYRKRPGVAVAAVPGTSNHGLGLSVDIHHGAIQSWLRKNGRRFGFIAEVRSEAWHWSYLSPGTDAYRSMGAIDHGKVQKIVGAKVDHKIGPKTVAKIKEWQKARGLEVDGKIGPKTYGAMGLGGGAPAAPKPSGSKPASTTSTSYGFAYTFARDEWDTQGRSDTLVALEPDAVEGIYLHYPAAGRITLADTSLDSLAQRLRGYRSDHVKSKGWKDIAYSAAVDQAGHTYELRGLGMETGANGGSTSNNHAGAILMLVGNNEDPSPKMVAAVNGLLAQYKKRFPRASWIRGHQQSPDASTDCPGVKIMALIDAGSFSYDGKPSAGSGSSKQPSRIIVDGVMSRGGLYAKTLQGRLGVAQDGKIGPASVRALQNFLGTPADGKITGQNTTGRKANPAFNSANFVLGKGGSRAVRALQAYAGVKVDGLWGPATNKAVATLLNSNPQAFTAKAKPKAPAVEAPAARIIVDGVMSRGKLYAKTLQGRLGVTQDGKIGTDSVRALQTFLGTPVDGKITGQNTTGKKANPAFNAANFVLGKGGSRAVRHLQAYVGVKPDGLWGPATNKAVTRMLNTYPQAFTAKDKAVAAARAKGAKL